ncbi:MAG: gliding motility-associated C-terminal domain-containing protein [Bizionia sp.]|nr:gliding motility-associated C-terminal domain-containing protein [Bizionia sp.]
MKKITHLLAMLTILLGLQANAQIATFPFNEDFEAGAGGWTANGGSWALGAPANTVINSADSGTNAWVTNLTGTYNSNENSSVVSPVFDFTTLAAPAVQLSVWWNSEFSWDGAVLQSSIDGGASWQNVGAFGDANNWYNDNTINSNPGGQQEGWTGRVGSGNGSGGWVVARHALIGLAGESAVTLRIAFSADGSVNDEGFAFDTVSVYEVTCPEPLNLSASNITATSANIAWDLGGAETDWEVVTQLAGTGVPTGNGDAATSNTAYVASGLTPASNYEVYVRSVCGTEFSPWVGPFNFATECVTFTAPYTEGFENGGTIPLCWTMSGGEDWSFSNTGAGNHIGNNGTITGNTITNGYFAWVDSSGENGATTLTTPFVDVSGLITPSISFYEISDNEGNASSQLDVEVWDGAAWNLMGTYNTNTSGWEKKVINISTLTITGDVQARFVFTEPTPSGFYDDIAIDDVTFDELPSCVNPSNLGIVNTTDTTATISWVSNGLETDWEVAVQAPGTGTPAGNGDATAVNPYVATGLTPATNYEAYVRSDCNGEYSDWIGPINFATECVTFVAPYTEGFENGGTIPLCWTMSGGEDWNFDNDPGFDHIGNNGVINGATATNGYFAWVDASGTDAPAVLLSPLVDVSGLTNPALSFYELSHNEGNANSQLDVEVWDGAAWNLMGTYNTNTAGWELKYLDLSGLTITGDVQARFIFSEVISPGDFYDDIAIDDVTFDELPPCIQPGGISVTNITGISADVSWMPGGGETAWEYVVQPAGTGVPTTGTAVTTTTVSETGLSFQTEYEVYVRSNCGIEGFSAWSGPVNFTTTVQLNFTVDCTVGPVNFTYCYENNDTNVFTFTSTDGTPLNFAVNAGTVESNWDEFQVFDTDGTDLNAATPYGNNGNLAGITYVSTGDTISFAITSDGSTGCSTVSAFDTLDITVSCATCVNPEATFMVIDDCDNGDQFLVDVNITSLGDATSVLISDNQGSTPVSVLATGITQFGPFPFATDVIFTVANEQDVNCVITSAAIQLLACPPSNDNCIGATVAQVNTDGSCAVTTPGTILEATPSGVPTGTCGGDPNDDVWFEFTALHELEMISILNIQGGTTNLDFGIYEGACNALVEMECFTTDSGITPPLTIGNTYYIRVFSGGSAADSSTFDLCITEPPSGTSCDNAGTFCNNNGVQTTPNLTNFPSGGQIACLFSTPNPVWNIIQIGDSGTIEIQITQTSATGQGQDVDFVLWGPFDTATDFCEADVLDQGCPNPSDCPNNTSNSNFYPSGNIIDCSYSAASTENLTIDNAVSGEVYVLLVTNFSNQPGDIQIQQTNSNGTGAGSTVAELDVEITSNDVAFIDDDNDELTPAVASLCGFDSTTLTAESPFAETYEWFQNGIILDGETAGTLVVTESDFYSVVAYDSDCEVYSQYDVILNFYKDAVANAAPDMVTCDISGDGTEDFNLEAQTAIILGAQSETDFAVTYHATLGDAQAGTNALASPYNAGDNTVIYVRVEDLDAVGSGSGCASTNTSFNLLITGATPEATSVDYELCDDESYDEVELFDLNAHSIEVLNGQDPANYNVSYYLTQTDADAGTNALTSPYENVANPQTIYVRVENNVSADCYATAALDLIVTPLADTTIDTSAMYEVCPNATSPITITATGNNYTESEVTITWYRDGVVIPGQTSLALNNVFVAGTYTIEVAFNNSSCPATSDDVEVSELESCIIPQGISPNGDNKNDNFDLSSFDVQSLEIFNRYGTKVYSKANYTNEWFGQSQDGDELPVGTYYYVMKYQGGKVKTSWVYINR